MGIVDPDFIRSAVQRCLPGSAGSRRLGPLVPSAGPARNHGDAMGREPPRGEARLVTDLAHVISFTDYHRPPRAPSVAVRHERHGVTQGAELLSDGERQGSAPRAAQRGPPNPHDRKTTRQFKRPDRRRQVPPQR